MLLDKLALAAQRLLVRLPSPIRVGARYLVRRFSISSRAPALEGWERPLIFKSTTTDPVEVSLEHAAAHHSEAPAQSGGPRDLLRCLIVTDSLDAGGMDEMVGFLARRLPEFGFQTAVLHAPSGPRPPGRLAMRLREAGIEVADHMEDEGREWLRAWHPDVLSVHGAPDWVILSAADASVPIVETLHGMHSLFNAKHDCVARRAANLTTIVAVSELVRRQYLNINPDFGIDRVVTVPNGVDLTRFPKIPRSWARSKLGLTDEYLFLSLSRISLQKNIFGLATAFSDVALDCPEVHLAIAGRPDPGTYSTQVRRLQRSMPGGNRLHLRDHSPEPALLLAASDGFVLDSFFEGWSLASMEAIAMGVPAVISEVGGAREQLAGKPERGILVSNPGGDPLTVDWKRISASRFRTQPNRHELVGAMTTLVEKRDSLLALRSKIKHEALDEFRADRCVFRHAEILVAAAENR